MCKAAALPVRVGFVKISETGTVAHACHPSVQGVEAGEILEVRVHLEVHNHSVLQ